MPPVVPQGNPYPPQPGPTRVVGGPAAGTDRPHPGGPPYGGRPQPGHASPGPPQYGGQPAYPFMYPMDQEQAAEWARTMVPTAIRMQHEAGKQYRGQQLAMTSASFGIVGVIAMLLIAVPFAGMGDSGAMTVVAVLSAAFGAVVVGLALAARQANRVTQLPIGSAITCGLVGGTLLLLGGAVLFVAAILL